MGLKGMSATKFSRYCLTSFLAFLRRLGLLGEAGVQPGCGLAVVTEAQRGDRASGAVKTFNI